MFFANFAVLTAILGAIGYGIAMTSLKATMIYAVFALAFVGFALWRSAREYRAYRKENLLIQAEHRDAELASQLREAPAVLAAQLDNNELATRLRGFQSLVQAWEARPGAEEWLDTVRGRHGIETLRALCQGMLNDELLLGSPAAQQRLMASLVKITTRIEGQLDRDREDRGAAFALECKLLDRQIA